jgi:hypothetical protein
MKKLFLFSALALSSTQVYSSERTVESLYNNTCWYGEYGDIYAPDLVWGKFVSFPEEMTVQNINQEKFDREGLGKNLEKAVNPYGASLKGRSFDLSLYCHSMGHEVYLNFHDQEPKVCVKASFNKKTKQLENFLVGGNAYGAGFCFPHVVGEIISFSYQNTNLQLLASDLKEAYPAIKEIKIKSRGVVETVARASKNLNAGSKEPIDFAHTIMIYLKDEYRFKEQEIMAAMRNDPRFTKKLATTDTNGYVTFVGESTKMGEYKASVTE